MTDQYQCRLQRQVVSGVTETTTGWIDAAGAKVGARVELQKGSGVFWTVLSVGNSLPQDMLKEHQRMHRKSFASIEGMGS